MNMIEEVVNEDKSPQNDDVHVLDILQEMRSAGLPGDFILLLMRYVLEYDGIKNLMAMWSEETDSQERENIITDLQESLDDILTAPSKPEERPYLHFDDLKEIKKDIEGFKEQLRKEVDKRGGISELARKSGIPQPSLSRFFSSTSMPRRTTLYKIAKALDLPESTVSFKWMR